MSQADSAMKARQMPSGSWKPRPKIDDSRPSPAGRRRRTSAGAPPSAAAAGFRCLHPSRPIRSGASVAEPSCLHPGGACAPNAVPWRPAGTPDEHRTAAQPRRRGHLRRACRVSTTIPCTSQSTRANSREPPPVAVRDAAQGLSATSSPSTASTSPCGRLHHGAARRQRRRQDHHHLHADGARGADLRRGARVRRRHGARALPGAAPHELREPLRRRARCG